MATTSFDLMGSFLQDEAGNLVMLFGAVPVCFTSPTPFGVPTQAPMPKPLGLTTEETPEDDDKECFVVTQKGRECNIFSISPKPKRSRRSTPKKRMTAFTPSLTVVVPPKTTKKRALQVYQEELVAYPNFPTSNTFTPLRIVKKNSPTARIRSVREIPKVVSSPHRTRNAFPESARVENLGRAVYQAHKALRDRRQRRNAHHFQPAQNVVRQVWVPKESGNMTQTQLDSTKLGLVSNPQSFITPNHKLHQKANVLSLPRIQTQGRKDSKPNQVYVPKDHQPGKKGSVFERLGARQNPSPQKTGGMTIIALNPTNKKRRVIQQQIEPEEEEFTVYAISVVEDSSSQEGDINPTVYAIGDNDEEEELSANMGTNEPLVRARERAKSRNTGKLGESDGDAVGACWHKLNSPKRS